MKRTVTLFALLSSLANFTYAQEIVIDPSPDVAEAGSVAAIAEFTSEPRFLSPWVAYVPASDSVPSPTAVLGHLVGAPGELTHSAKIVDYVRQVAASSPRVHVETLGVVGGGQGNCPGRNCRRAGYR